MEIIPPIPDRLQATDYSRYDRILSRASRMFVKGTRYEAIQINENNYIVGKPDEKVRYEVNVKDGTCTCPSFIENQHQYKQGFCKHVAGLRLLIKDGNYKVTEKYKRIIIT